MKGVYLTTFILLFLTLVFMFYVYRNFSAASAASTEFVSSIQVQQIAGIINVLQTTSGDGSHIYSLPKGNCEMRISSVVTFVQHSGNEKISTTHGIIRTGVEVKDSSIKCDPLKDKRLFIRRCGNQIDVTEIENPC
jgi:preprotein translocase subunit YajC